MKNNIVNLAKKRNRKKIKSPEDSAEISARRILDKVPKDLKEPEALASGGDMSKILEEEEEDKNEKN